MVRYSAWMATLAAELRGVPSIPGATTSWNFFLLKCPIPMKHTDELLASFDKSWEAFAGAWKKARTKPSEKSIHDLRVSTRRLIATLELASALTRRDEIPKLQDRFKKVLKRLGPLRDIQVQLEGLSQIQRLALISEFKKTLERRERREVDDIRDNLKRGRKRRLSKRVQNMRSEFGRLHESL